MSIVKKIKTLCESVSGLPFLYSSRGGLNVLLDNTEYPCVYMTLLKTSSVANENGMLVESAQVAVVVVDKSEYDIESIENEDVIDRCRLIANNIVQNADTTGEVRVESVQGGERFYNEYDVILTGYAVNVTFAEIIGDSGCEVAPSVAVFSENGSYNVKGVQVAEVAVPPMSEKEQLLNYFRKGGRFLSAFRATEEYDLDLSTFDLQFQQGQMWVNAYDRNWLVRGNLILDLKNSPLGNQNSSFFNSATVEGDLECRGLRFGQQVLWYLRVGGRFIAKNATSWYAYAVFQTFDCKEIDLENFIYSGYQGGVQFSFSQCYSLQWLNFVNGDWGRSHDVFQPLAMFCGRLNNDWYTLIGDYENEPYDENLVCYKNNYGPVIMRYVPSIRWKSLMAMSNGFVDYTTTTDTGKGEPSLTILAQHINELQGANMWEVFEERVLSKGWTIYVE